MTDYVWQLGIDWNAIQTGGVGYLRGGLGRYVTNGEVTTFVPSPGTEPVEKDDTITFRIFDVTSSVQNRRVASIGAFGIDYQMAVKDQPSEKPLDNIQPAIASSNESAQSSLFGPAYCSWDLETVTVAAASGRFLLTVYLQATGPGGVVRLFNHDPEMVVGANGG